MFVIDSPAMNTTNDVLFNPCLVLVTVRPTISPSDNRTLKLFDHVQFVPNIGQNFVNLQVTHFNLKTLGGNVCFDISIHVSDHVQVRLL